MPDTTTNFAPILSWLSEHNVKRLAIVGSRKYPHLTHVDRFVVALPKDMVIITGGAQGVDRRAEEMARQHGLTVELFLPEYDRFPPETRRRAAPLARNQQIVDAADAVVAFHAGVSTGTMHIVNLAKKEGKPVVVIEPMKATTEETTKGDTTNAHHS